MTRRWATGAAAALMVAAALPALPGHAAGQDHLFSITGYLGSASYGDLAAGEDPGVPLAPGGFYGLQAELWLGRFGARLHSGFADTGLENDSDTGFGIVAIDADFLARLRRPRPGQVFQPFGVVGFGVVRYSTGTDATTVAGYDYGRDPENRASMVLGIGADFMGGPLAFRLELMDIIGFSSPLGPGDGSTFGPVSHAVLTFGLSYRIGRFRLPPETVRPRPRPRPVPTRTRPPRDSAAPPPSDSVEAVDTAAVDTATADTVRRPLKPTAPTPPPRDTTVSVDTTSPPTLAPPPQPPDTTRRPPVRPPMDTTRAPPPRRDTTLEPPRRPPVQTPRPPPVDTTVSVDTTAPPRRPPDSARTPTREPPRQRDPTRPPRPPTDTTQTPPPETQPPTKPGPATDTTDAPPTDTAEAPTDTTDTDDEARGRLFTVRVSWDPDADHEVDAVAALLAVLEAADVPLWPIEQAGGESHRRVAALRNAADARTLGNHIEAEYGLAWEWVHIDKDEAVPAEAVDASTAFVDGLDEGPGGRGGGAPGAGGPPDR